MKSVQHTPGPVFFRTLLMLCWCFFPFLFYTQNTTANAIIESLKQNQPDTNLVISLIDFSKSTRDADPDTALFFATKAAEVAEKVKYPSGLATSLNIIGLVHRIKGDFDLAQKYMLRAAEIKRQCRDIKGFSSVVSNLGMVNTDMGNYPQSLKYYAIALDLKKRVGDKKGVTNVYNNMGLVHEWMGNYPDALKSYLIALKMAEETADTSNLSACFHNVANIYNQEGNYEEAIKYYLVALKLNEARNNKVWLITNNNSIGSVFFSTGKYQESKEKYLTALKLAEEIGDRKGQASAYNNLGVSMEWENDYVNAAENYRRSMRLRKEINDINGMAIVGNNLARLNIKMKKFSAARALADTALQMALSVSAKDVAIDSYLYLSKSDSAMGAYSSSFENYKKYILCRDSVSNEENTRKTVQVRLQYEFDKKETASKAAQEKKDALAAEQLKQQKAQRNYFIAGFVLVLLLAGFILRSFLLKRKANHLLEEKNILIEKQKQMVEEKQKEILDSIRYAKRIQQALITSEINFARQLSRLRRK